MMKLHTILTILALLILASILANFATKSKESLEFLVATSNCEIVRSYKATKGLLLDGIIKSLVESQDFSSYCRDDFNVAREWFLNMTNHPSAEWPTGDKEYNNYIKEKYVMEYNNHMKEYNNYMKERLILALIYSANCKDDCSAILIKGRWLSAKNHCHWRGVTCNKSKEVTKLNMDRFNLTRRFTLFGFNSIQDVCLSDNSLSGTFAVVGASENLKRLALWGNKVTAFTGGNVLKNLETLYLSVNAFEGDFIINEENFPTSLKLLSFARNKLEGFVGLQIFKTLETLYLDDNEIEGDFIINEENFPTSLKTLSLTGNNLEGLFGLQILTNLDSLFIERNEIVGNFIINEENFPTSIKTLGLSGNKLTGFVGLQILTKLETLFFSYSSDFEGDFIITEETFPTSIESLHLTGRKLTGFAGLQILTNLEEFSFGDTDFVGEFIINEMNFPKSIKYLYVCRNKLMTGFVGGGILTNLKDLYLQDNKFEGDFIITSENFPDSLTYLSLDNNTGLTSIDADSDAVPKLDILAVEKIEGITVKEELCKRPGRIVYSSKNACADIIEG